MKVLIILLSVISLISAEEFLATHFKKIIPCNNNTGICMAPEECYPSENGDKIQIDFIDER